MQMTTPAVARSAEAYGNASLAHSRHCLYKSVQNVIDEPCAVFVCLEEDTFRVQLYAQSVFGLLGGE